MNYDDAIMDSIRSMVDREVVRDIEAAFGALREYKGPMTRRRVVAAIVRSAGVDADFPAWRAFAPGTAPSIQDIMEAVCHEGGASLDAVIARGMRSDVCRVRSSVAWCARRGFGYTLGMIGERMGGRGHTTILHAVGKMDVLTGRQPAIMSSLLRICDDLDDRVIRRHYAIDDAQAADAGSLSES